MDEARTVEEDVRRLHASREGLYGLGIQHVEDGRIQFGFPCEPGELFSVDVGRNDLGALAGKGQRARPSHPLPRRRHDSGLASKPSAHFRSPVCFANCPFSFFTARRNPQVPEAD